MLPSPLSGADRAAYDALHTGAVALHRPDLHHLVFTGPKAGDVLTGLVTNHVLSLAVGAGQYAATLTPKGKVVADLRVVRVDEERFLTTAAAACWPGWRDLVRKFVNPRFAKYTEPDLATLTLAGPGAHAAADRLLASLGATPVHVPADPAAPYACTRLAARDAELGDAELGDAELLRVVSPELGDLPGLDLLLPSALVERALDVLRADPSVTDGTERALDVARIEAGRPRWGRDMDDTTIPQEANLGELGALSFEKGCYTGQETVARLHFRGHVNRYLRLLRADAPIPGGAELRLDDGKVVGDVRSSAVSPRLGAVAIAMVRREVPAGTTLDAVGDGQPAVRVRIER